MRRLKRKRLTRVPVATHLVRSNQEWALDFACDTLATGRGIGVLAVVDAFTRENLSLEVDITPVGNLPEHSPPASEGLESSRFNVTKRSLNLVRYLHDL